MKRRYVCSTASMLDFHTLALEKMNYHWVCKTVCTDTLDKQKVVEEDVCESYSAIFRCTNVLKPSFMSGIYSMWGWLSFIIWWLLRDHIFFCRVLCVFQLHASMPTSWRSSWGNPSTRHLTRTWQTDSTSCSHLWTSLITLLLAAWCRGQYTVNYPQTFHIAPVSLSVIHAVCRNTTVLYSHQSLHLTSRTLLIMHAGAEVHALVSLI